MHLRFLFLVVIASLAFGCAPRVDQAPLSGLMAYRDALLAADGTAAWRAVDSRTQSYYNLIVEDIRSAPRDKVLKMDLVSKLTVVRSRVEFSRAELEAMTGERLFAIGVERQWISKASVQNLGETMVTENDGVSSSIAVKTDPSTTAFTLMKEDGEWKVALSLSFDLANRALQQMVTDSGLSEDEFVFAIVRKLSRFDFDESILDGPRR